MVYGTLFTETIRITVLHLALKLHNSLFFVCKRNLIAG